MVKYRASLSLNAEGVTASAAKAQLIKRIKCDSGINNNIIVTETYEPAPVEREELVLQLMSRFGVRQELASQIINDGELKSMPNTVKSPIQVLFIPDSNIYEYSTFDEFFNGVVENEIQDDSDTYIIYCDGDVRDWDWVRSKMGDRIKELFPKLSHKFVCAVSQKLINGDASIEEFFDLRYCYAFWVMEMYSMSMDIIQRTSKVILVAIMTNTKTWWQYSFQGKAC